MKEFSGYYCEDGNFVVGLVRLDAAIKQAVTDRLEPGMASYWSASSTLVFVEKKHSFLSLRAWRDTINLEYFEIDGAVSLGISYTENRIVLGVESRGRDAAHELVRDYELPSDGYVIVEEGPVIPE